MTQIEMTSTERMTAAIDSASDEFKYALGLVKGTMNALNMKDEQATVRATNMVLMRSNDIYNEMVKDEQRQAKKEADAKAGANGSSKPSEKPQEKVPPQAQMPSERASKPAPEAKKAISMEEAFDYPNGTWVKCPTCGNEDIHHQSSAGKPYDACWECRTWLNVNKDGSPQRPEVMKSKRK